MIVSLCCKAIADVKRRLNLDDDTAKRLVWRVKQDMLGRLEEGGGVLSWLGFLGGQLLGCI